MSALALGRDALAAFRLTKLVVDDMLTAELRDAVIQQAYVAAGREGEALRQLEERGHELRPGIWAEEVVPNDSDPPKLAFLVTCPWCAGMWVALGVVAARRLLPRAWEPLAEALALSAAAGIIAGAIE